MMTQPQNQLPLPNSAGPKVTEVVILRPITT